MGLPATIQIAIEHPKLTIVAALIFTLSAAGGIVRLHLSVDGHALVPVNAPEILIDSSIRQRFGVSDPFVILIRTSHPNGIFNPETVSLVRALTAEFAGLEGLATDGLTSLANVPGFRHRPGTVKLENLLESPLTADEELVRLRADVEKIGIYHGTLVSLDFRSTAIYLSPSRDWERERFMASVQSIIQQRNHENHTLDILGAPVAEMLLGRHILRDLGGAALTGADTQIGPGSGGSPNLLQLIGSRTGLVLPALILLALVFLIAFRRFWCLLLPLTEAGAAVAFSLGLMGWTNTPVYLTIAVMPVILAAMGVTDEIHIFNRYRVLVRENSAVQPRVTVAAVMETLWLPVVKTSVTTAIGFASFGFSSIGPVRAFGLFTAIGILFCMLWSLTVIPAAMTLFHQEALVPLNSGSDANEPTPLLRSFSSTVTGHPKKIVVGCFALMIVTPLGMKNLMVQDSWLSGFAPQSGFRLATQHFDRQFLGSHLLLVEVDGGGRVFEGSIRGSDLGDHRFTLPGEWGRPELLQDSRISFSLKAPVGENGLREVGKSWFSFIQTAEREGTQNVVTTPKQSGSPNFWLRPAPDDEVLVTVDCRPFLKPKFLDRLDALKSFLEKLKKDSVGGVLAPTDYLKTTAWMLHTEDSGSFSLPKEPKQAEALWSRYRFIRGEAKLRQLVDATFGRGLVTVFLKDANYRDTANLVSTIRDFEKRDLQPHGISLALAGDVAVSQTLIRNLVSSQQWTLALSLFGIALVATIWDRSLRWGLLVVAPSLCAILLCLAVMGWAGIHIGVATSMFAAMTLGLGVDFAIHLLECTRSWHNLGESNQVAIQKAIEHTAPAVIINTFALATGFGILAFSQVPANSSLGLLMAVGVTGCALISMCLIPALLCLFPLKIEMS